MSKGEAMASRRTSRLQHRASRNPTGRHKGRQAKAKPSSCCELAVRRSRPLGGLVQVGKMPSDRRKKFAAIPADSVAESVERQIKTDDGITKTGSDGDRFSDMHGMSHVAWVTVPCRTARIHRRRHRIAVRTVWTSKGSNPPQSR